MFDPGRSALLLIDLQNDFVRKGAPVEVETMVVQDCVTSFSDELQEAFIKNFKMKSSWAASSEEIINIIRKGEEIW